MKFIHMADMHLGMEPEKGTHWSKERGRELWETFGRIIDLCVEEKADLLLIAGDLFHRQPSLADKKEIQYQFSKLGRTKVVMLAGNHDYLGRKGHMTELEREDRVMLLPAGEATSLLIPSCNTTIYGCSFEGRQEKQNPYQGIHPHRTRGYHILLAHGGDAEHMPFDRQELAAAGFDYVALGHIHKPEIYGKAMAYAGSPEPLDKTETGEHGVILGDLTPEGCEVKFLPLSKRVYREIRLDWQEEMSLSEAADRILFQIQEMGTDDFYRVHLCGWHDPDLVPDVDELMEKLSDRGRVVEITDETRPFLDFEMLYHKNRDNVLGRFIETVGKQDQSDEWKEKVMTAGVMALLSGKNE